MSGANPPPLPRLVILQPSHYCEKARWALQRYSIAVDVDTQAPGFHQKATKGKRSTPCLIFPDGTFKDDSTLILRWIDEQQAPNSANPKLFPSDCDELVSAECSKFDNGLGVDARQVIYAHCLDSPLAYNALTANVPAWQRTTMSLGFWYVVRAVMRSGMKISTANGAKALERVRAEFRRVGDLLADGRPFLCGQHFTAADLTFAALAAPMLGVKYGDAPFFTKDDDMPKAVRDITDDLRATPAGVFALRIWETQRSVVL